MRAETSDSDERVFETGGDGFYLRTLLVIFRVRFGMFDFETHDVFYWPRWRDRLIFFLHKNHRQTKENTMEMCQTDDQPTILKQRVACWFDRLNRFWDGSGKNMVHMFVVQYSWVKYWWWSPADTRKIDVYLFLPSVVVSYKKIMEIDLLILKWSYEFCWTILVDLLSGKDCKFYQNFERASIIHAGWCRTATPRIPSVHTQ